MDPKTVRKGRTVGLRVGGRCNLLQFKRAISVVFICLFIF